MGWFTLGRRRDERTAAASAEVAGIVRTCLGLKDEDAVTVSEIACGDPACGGAETVILVMRAGRKTEAVKVSKSLALITRPEIEDALQALRGG